MVRSRFIVDIVAVTVVWNEDGLVDVAADVEDVSDGVADEDDADFALKNDESTVVVIVDVLPCVILSASDLKARAYAFKCRPS